MMKLIAFFAGALTLAAQPTCTQITDMLYQVGTSAPAAMAGTIDLSLGYTIAPVGQSVRRITVVAGVVSACLVPGAYAATYSVQRPAPLTGSTTYSRTWTVPSLSSGALFDSGIPFDAGGLFDSANDGAFVMVAQIEGTAPVTPSTAVAAVQIAAGPEGSCMKVIGGVSGWFPCFPETWDQLTVPWVSLANVSWNTL